MIRPAGEEAPARGPGSSPFCFTILGSITPEGAVDLSFLPAFSAGSPTTGIGRAVVHRGAWAFEMQMATGSGTTTAHWAYMVQVRPGEPAWESLPGFGISVPEMLEGCVPPAAPAG